ncbi:uncharacterized protein [Macrobrachium rosenbergii]|uniref:uncharacterized protein n=1 Tax=Macrobrachium rosenbergii TaxID=79674 RepID=UPI0034D71C0E
MADVEFNPVEYLASEDCIRYLSALTKENLKACARSLGISLTNRELKKDVYKLVKNRLSELKQTADELISESMSESDVEGAPGLSLFQDPPHCGVIFEGYGSLPDNKSQTERDPLTDNVCPAVPTRSAKVENEPLVKDFQSMLELKKLEFEELERIRAHERAMLGMKLELAKIQQEFARVKQEHFDDWLKSRQVTTLAALKELILIEDFKKSCAKDLRVHLEDLKVTSFPRIAQLSDEYILTHKVGTENFRGKLRFEKEVINVKFLRDTGAARSLLLRSRLPLNVKIANYIILSGFPDTVVSAPVVEGEIDISGVVKSINLAIVDKLPIPGIDGILGNDLCNVGGRELFPILTLNKLPIAVTTRSQKKGRNLLMDGEDLHLDPVQVDVAVGRLESVGSSDSSKVVRAWNRADFIRAQHDEFDVEITERDDVSKPCFVSERGLLCRLSRSALMESSEYHKQILVPKQFRDELLQSAHEDPFSGHFGVTKTFKRLTKLFWWPNMRRCIKQFLRTCETCQVMGKPNQDRCAELAIQHITSVPYHPESQGVVERFHQTLKSIIGKYCYEQESSWDKELPYALFALRTHPNESTGVSPFRLVYGHEVRGLLEVLFEVLIGGRKQIQNLNIFLSNLKNKLSGAWKFAQDNLQASQASMKIFHDRKAVSRSFESGDLVLVLDMDPDSFLKPRFKGPWKVIRKVSDLNYELDSPGSTRKSRIFHINRLKKYEGRNPDPLNIVYEIPCPLVTVFSKVDDPDNDVDNHVSVENLKTNVEIFNKANVLLEHLDEVQKKDLLCLIKSFPEVFRETPGLTSWLEHDVEVGDARPVKQAPYRLNPEKAKVVEKEVQYMLDHDLIQPSSSPWSSPIVLVKKPDGDYRMCVDYRRVNQVLRKAGLVVNIKKCEFGKAVVTYLGHEVGLGKVAPKHANIEVIANLPQPCNVRGVRKILGMLGYYRRFVKNFADIAQPLTNLLKKNTKFLWSTECEKAFSNLKSVLVSEPILSSPNFNKPFVLAVDASDVGIGGVLFQRDDKGEMHPVSYFSKKLLPAERKYSTIEKEALALVKSVSHFSIYLSSSLQVEVLTDHNPLVFINKMKGANQRILRWALLLQEYNLVFQHIKGVDNKIPDALSRM